MNLDPMAKLLIGLGVVLVLAGLGSHFGWLQKIPLGRLPGDIVYEKAGTKMYFPLTTCLVVSLVLSLASWLFRRF